MIHQISLFLLAFLSVVTAVPLANHFSIRAASSPTAYLDAHNSVRASHGANPLTWSDSLAEQAQKWVNDCKVKQVDESLGPGVHGTNLAAGVGRFSASSAVNLFASDAQDYDPSLPTYNHFTQVVWKSTTVVGCAVAMCDGIFDSKFGKASYHACLYDPPGNVVGEAPANVQV